MAEKKYLKGEEYSGEFTTPEEEFVVKETRRLADKIHHSKLDVKHLDEDPYASTGIIRLIQTPKKIKGLLSEDRLRFVEFFLDVHKIMHVDEDKLRNILISAIEGNMTIDQQEIFADIAYWGGWITSVERDTIKTERTEPWTEKWKPEQKFSYKLARGWMKRKLSTSAAAKTSRKKGQIPYLSSDWCRHLYGEKK